MSVFRGFGRLAPLGELKDGLGMFGLADFQRVSIAWRKDRIARIPLRLRPANMKLVFFRILRLIEWHLDSSMLFDQGQNELDIAPKICKTGFNIQLSI